jgi:phospholipid/cholesterol/gamma-HCH transport system ATP-binding protein
MNSTTQPVIDIKNLSVTYGDRTILHDVTAAIQAQEIRVILGTSGCGKTTLLKAIIGLLKPAAGTVHLLGQLVTEQDSPGMTDVLRRIGVLFQNGALLGSLTVLDNVKLPLQMHSALSDSVIDEMARLRLSQVGLSHAVNLLPGELSGGMRKRAALARSLSLDPPLLFCDEPSAGLDPVTSAGLDDLLLRLRDTLGITIVVVTHELLSIEHIADNIIFLNKGTVLYEGPLSDARAAGIGPITDFFARKESVVPGTVKATPLFVTELVL